MFNFNYILDNLKNNGIILKNKKIVFGFSGGPDSSLLFHFLLWLREKENIYFKIMHLNHKERQEADEEEVYVKRVCEKYNVPYSLYTENIYDKKGTKIHGFEMCARMFRLKYFESELKQINGDYIFTAHTLNDRVETMFINIERGTGIRGLISMKLINGKYVKPLININKKDILDYLNNNGIEYIYDNTNENTVFARNRIRHNIIPAIERHLKKGITPFDDLLDKMEDIYEILKIMIKENFQNSISKEYNKIIIDISPLLLYNNKIIKFVLYFNIGNDYKVNENIIEEIIKIMNSQKGYVKRMFKEFVCEKIYNKLIIYPLCFDKQMELKEVCLKEGNSIQWGNYTISFKKTDYCDFNNNNCVYFPLSIGNEIIIRKRKCGDRFIPFGFNKSVKLSKFLIKQKIPAYIRESIPIVLSKNNDILWIAGIRRTAKYKIENNKEYYEIKKS